MLINSPCTDNSKLHIPCTLMSDLLAASNSKCMAFIGVSIAFVSTSLSYHCSDIALMTAPGSTRKSMGESPIHPARYHDSRG